MIFPYYPHSVQHTLPLLSQGAFASLCCWSSCRGLTDSPFTAQQPKPSRKLEKPEKPKEPNRKQSKTIEKTKKNKKNKDLGKL